MGFVRDNKEFTDGSKQIATSDLASKVGKPDEIRITLFQHLEELRKRLLWSVVFFVGVFIICFIFADKLLLVAIGPHLKVASWFRKENIKFSQELISLTYLAPFMAYLKLALIFALFFSSPFTAYQIWKFVGAGLYKNERRYVLIFAPFSFILFIAGSLFGYFLLVPYGLYFLAKYADPNILTLQFSLSSYLDFMLWLTIVMGIVFQLPLIMIFFSLIGLIKPSTYIKVWKYVIVIIFFVSAVVTPGPDIFSQCAMAIPLCFLYVIGIIGSKLVGASRTPE